MMEIECHRVLCCEEEVWVSLGLFTSVTNSSRLRNEAASGKIEAALLDPTMIVSPFHILAAANRALVSREQNQMKTKNIYSEIIFSLSPSTNMANSFKSFGVKDDSPNMLVVTVHNQEEDSKFPSLLEQIQGMLVPMSNLSSVHREEEIIKLYKVTPEELAISSLENSVVTRLVIKDAI